MTENVLIQRFYCTADNLRDTYLEYQPHPARGAALLLSALERLRHPDHHLGHAYRQSRIFDSGTLHLLYVDWKDVSEFGAKVFKVTLAG